MRRPHKERDTSDVSGLLHASTHLRFVRRGDRAGGGFASAVEDRGRGQGAQLAAGALQAADAAEVVGARLGVDVVLRAYSNNP